MMSRLNQRNIVVVSGHNEENSVLYLMTKSFRIRNNYTLFQSIEYSRKHGCPLKIILVEPYEINPRNILWFHQFTADLIKQLKVYSNDVSLINRSQLNEERFKDVHTVFTDKAYLKFDIDLLRQVKTIAYKMDMILIEVETNVFVPITLASNKEEYQARTIRPKVHRLLEDFSEEVLTDATLSKGENQAFKILDVFIEDKLPYYDQHNDPSLKKTSLLSPFLKYGFISPISIYHKINHHDPQAESFLEELIVRRELAYNFVYYNQGYDQFDKMTDEWAYLTMKQHLKDQRNYVYSKDDYIHFRTHDRYFNAAMKEMIYKGRMHSYMRMYWCKKIIEWSKTYQEAFDIASALNNEFFLDGLTPNGYTGVAWCFGKHDRAWFERDIFGKLRYMNDNGLKRKFDIETYVSQMNELIEEDIDVI